MSSNEAKDPLNVKRLVFWLVLLAAAAAAAMIFLPAGLVRLAVLALLAAPAAFVIFDRPEWAMYIILFMAFSNVFIFLGVPVIRILLLLILASMAIRIVGGRRLVVHDRNLYFIVAAFLLIAFHSMAFARDIGSSLYRLGIFFNFLLIIYLTLQLVNDRRRLMYVLIVISAGMLVNNFLPFILPPPEIVGDLALIWEQAVYRYEGYMREPNIFAFANIFFMPFLFFLFWRFARPWFVRPIILAAIAGSVFVLFLSFSRGGFVSLVAMFAALMIVERKNRKVLVSGLALMAVFILMAPAVYWSRLSSLVNLRDSISTDYAFMSRMEAMKVALILGVKNPVLGIGIENFQFYVSRYIPFGSFVHNSILQVFADMGIPGLLVYLTLIAYNLRITLRLMSDPDRELAQLGKMLLVQQVAVQVNSMFLPVVFNLEFWLPLTLPSLALFVYRNDPLRVGKAEGESGGKGLEGSSA